MELRFERFVLLSYTFFAGGQALAFCLCQGGFDVGSVIAMIVIMIFGAGRRDVNRVAAGGGRR